ncbi:MAG: hypothetical protein QM627_00765 [Luteolibacter sp.]
MRFHGLALFLAGTMMLHGQDKAPGVEAAIPPPVKALGSPLPAPFPNGVTLAVSAATDGAQREVIAGLNHLNGGWEFEASRHFAAALREDPECLLAHWGMIVATLAPSPETGPARNVATDRLLDLVNRGVGTELERGYAYGLVKYMEGGPGAASEAFRKVAERFPNDMQATIFYALFTRGGYDALGSATPDQEKAEEILRGLIEKFPESPVPINALLTIRAEAPDLTDALPLARKLIQMAPSYAPYHHLLGHYEWRCGNHAKAASAFGRASGLYAKWMRENNATVADCPEWVRSESYRTVAMASKGDFDTAFASAKRLAVTPFPKERLSSNGVHLLMWEAKTLPTRLLMRRGAEGMVPEALAFLPTPEETRGFREKSLSYWWIDALRIFLDTQRLLEAGDVEQARATLKVLERHIESMGQLQRTAKMLGEQSSLSRSFYAVEGIARELRGRLALAGPPETRVTAYNWFRSAADHQKPASLLMPPVILQPMAIRVGDFLMLEGKAGEAITAYDEALQAFPNDMNALVGLEKACEAAKLTERAAEVRKRIQALQAE